MRRVRECPSCGARAYTVKAPVVGKLDLGLDWRFALAAFIIGAALLALGIADVNEPYGFVFLCSCGLYALAVGAWMALGAPWWRRQTRRCERCGYVQLPMADR